QEPELSPDAPQRVQRLHILDTEHGQVSAYRVATLEHLQVRRGERSHVTDENPPARAATVGRRCHATDPDITSAPHAHPPADPAPTPDPVATARAAAIAAARTST